ncbi:DUF4303 domain-containing protein [Anaerotignum sp.]|uniref:DUF4303 domain-containing protein n=1 Tax=Anaerotignum sp. TaxID=2039241 RepID=UPI002A81F719|nr:DUF4303 domain-containing protein [Anaerotignum sp.]MDY3595632.1 DUF4303 domain-containing protein [Anaerotignum sp.]
MTKDEVLALLIHDMEKFLHTHSDLQFYALAFDCNAEYANFLVCMNTIEEFEKTLQWYQKKYETYDQEENILDLRYNPGDWEYTDISQVDVFQEEELAAKYQDDIDKQCEEIMDFCEDILRDFKKTDVFEKIPKTSDFIAFCIDHDEDVKEALERQNVI